MTVDNSTTQPATNIQITCATSSGVLRNVLLSLLCSLVERLLYLRPSSELSWLPNFRSDCRTSLDLNGANRVETCGRTVPMLGICISTQTRAPTNGNPVNPVDSRSFDPSLRMTRIDFCAPFTVELPNDAHVPVACCMHVACMQMKMLHCAKSPNEDKHDVWAGPRQLLMNYVHASRPESRGQIET